MRGRTWLAVRGWAMAGAIAVTGCGYNQPAVPEGFTEVHFQSAQPRELTDLLSMRSTTLAGGTFIYAVRTDGLFATNFRVQNMPGSASFTLPNGSYNFAAFGFVSPSLSGGVYCGLAPATALTGGATAITLTLTSTGCGALPFVDANCASGGAIKPMGISICNTAAFDGVANATPVCTGGVAPATAVNSISVGFPIFIYQDGAPFTDMQGENPPFSTDAGVCMTMANPNNANGTIQIPYGDSTGVANMILPMRVVLHSDAFCGGVISKFQFLRGLSLPSAAKRVNAAGTNTGGGATVIKVFPGTGQAQLFLKHD